MRRSDVTCNFDVVIWCGDLNFRLSEDREVLMRNIANNFHDRISMSGKKSFSTSTSLLQADQLAAVLAAETILKGFKEAPIQFLPTYKYDPGTQNYDTSSKQRAPAYTDRILYKTKSVNTGSTIPGKESFRQKYRIILIYLF
jgi:inositol polyphosphate 5-phosphatase INPP5E